MTRVSIPIALGLAALFGMFISAGAISTGVQSSEPEAHALSIGIPGADPDEGVASCPGGGAPQCNQCTELDECVDACSGAYKCITGAGFCDAPQFNCKTKDVGIGIATGANTTYIP